MSEEQRILSHPARVHLMPHDRTALLAKARRFVGEDTVDEEIFTFRAEISNDLLDSHFTHMAESTLTNYNEDANTGVAFLRGHNWRELPIGYSMESLLEDVAGRKRVVTDFYTVRGLPDTNDLIHRLNARLVRDVSVGFGGGTMRCDICSNDFWECRHWPGLKYEVKDGDVMRDVVATFTIEDARLSEVSGVFDGSTPQAMILKAERFAAAGLLSQEEAYKLERQYRMSLPMKRSFAGVEIEQPKKGEEEMDLEKRVITTALNTGLVPKDQQDTLNVDGALTIIEQAGQRVKALEALADDGRAYRKDMVDEAIKQGVRLYGNEFKQEQYRAMLESSSLEMIRQTAQDWKVLADKTLPQGRHSEGDDTREQGRKVVQHDPVEAYA